uniref:Putative lambda recombination protein n=1 Tax=viral metagenome TaxID=1070528 RepID=A0A6M3LQ65_9ZZZZ
MSWGRSDMAIKGRGRAKTKHKSLTALKKACWELYSKWVRYSNEVDGYCTCYTCGVQKPPKEMHAGHGVGGRGNYVLFLDEVVKPQCPRCNLREPKGLNGNYEMFVPKLIAEIGHARYNEIVQMSRNPYKISVIWYEDKIRELKRILKEGR